MMDFLSKIEDDVLRRLYIYWDKCRGKRLFPARSDLDPVDFPYALGHIILLDVLQGNGPQFMVRLFGTWHAHRKGFDLTGRSIADDPDPINSARLQTVLEATLQHETPARFVSEFVTGSRIRHAENIVLPLAGDGRTIDMFLTCSRDIDNNT